MYFRIKHVLAAASVVATVCLGGCESPTVHQASDGGTGGEPATGFAGSPCRACLHEACAAPWSQCLADPECAAHVECVDACPTDDRGGPDAACEYACATPGSMTGMDALAALTQCRTSAPCAPCGNADVALPDVLTQTCASSSATNPVIRCLEENCCESGATCASPSSSCGDVIDCENACADALDVIACEAECWRNDPEGAADWAAYVTCGGYHCVEELGVTEPPCLICEREKCTNTWAACQLDVPCSLLLSCLALCYGQPAGCSDVCFAETPASSVALFEASDLCRKASCIAACAEDE